MVSSATNAGPGNLTEGALFAPFEPLAAPSGHAGRHAHTITQAEMAFSIDRIN
jgi:hypothetical protein